MIPPNLPGLINAINPNINVGDAMYPYRISWLTGVRIPASKRAAPIVLPNFQFFGSAAIYTACSLIWPARETMIKESIFDDDSNSNSNEIVLGVKPSINRPHSPIARTISVNDDRSEKGRPSWSA